MDFNPDPNKQATELLISCKKNSPNHRMYSFLEKNKLLNPKQFGFRHNHSTAHAMINLIENIKRHLADKKTCCWSFHGSGKSF